MMIKRRFVLGSIICVCGLLLLTGIAISNPVLAAAPGQDEDGLELTIIKTVVGENESVAPGETVQFQVVVTNTGTVTATGVVVEDDYNQVILPTIDAGTSGAQNDGDVLIWRVGDLLPGESWQATYQATAAAVFEGALDTVVNQATVSVEGDVVAQSQVALMVRLPDLTLARQLERVDGEGDIVPGATVRYTIRYSNNGTADATNVSLVETYDGDVIQDVFNVIGDGVIGEESIAWSLGTVTAGASGEVSYEVTLKPALTQGDDIDVRNQAVIQADGVERLTSEEIFTLSTPLLSIERQRDDLNGGAIEPGDTLRFTIVVRNSGAAALDVVVRDDFYEQVVAEVSNISEGGREVEGAVEWVLTDLAANSEQTFSYRVRLISEIGQATTAANSAIILIGDVEVDRSQTSMTIEPRLAVEAETQIFVEQPLTVAILVGSSAVAALGVVGGLAILILRRNQWRAHYFRFVIEGVAVVVIIEAVLVLAMNNSIEPDGAVTILSGLAGYLLGRALGESQENDYISTPAEPKTPDQESDQQALDVPVDEEDDENGDRQHAPAVK